MKFLIDECLSPDLAQLARERGHPESTHVTWLGLGSAKDWTIARRAVDEGFVFVTNNRVDFLNLYAGEEFHGGLICLNAAHKTMDGTQQRRLFALALTRLAGPTPLQRRPGNYLGAGGGLSRRAVQTVRRRLAR